MPDIRCSQKRIVLAVIAMLLTTGPVSAADTLPKCAIIVSQADSTGVIVADLLAVELAAKGYPVVDRANLNRTLGEQELAQAFAPEETAIRRKVGKIAGADLLILLTSRKSEGSEAIEWSVASMPAGLRLSKGGAPWDEMHPEELAGMILASVSRAVALADDESIKIVCVSPFICRDASYEKIDKQAIYKAQAEDSLMRIPGVAVVEVDEVESLIRESNLAPNSARRAAPHFLLGEYITSKSKAKPTTTLAIQVRNANKAFGSKKITASSDDELAASLSSAVAELLLETTDEQRLMRNSEESEALAAHALTLVHMGERKDALPLLKIASLWAPDNLELRRLVFATLEGMVASSVGTTETQQELAHFVGLLEQTLDAFEDMVRRRTIGLKDLHALSGFRSNNGYLSYTRKVKRKFPVVVARYFAFNTRYRRTLRDILGGKYGELDTKSRDTALGMLVSRLSSDSWRSLDPAHDETIDLLHELAAAPGDEHHVIQLFLNHKSGPDARSNRDKRFWQDCCPPDFRRLDSLLNLSENIRQLESQDDLANFEALLEKSRKELQLSDDVCGQILAISRKRLSEALEQSAGLSSPIVRALPKLIEIPGSPARVMNWIVARPGEVEFIATRKDVYRATSHYTFEKIHEGRFPRIAWDTRYLWIGTNTELLVADSDGEIVARQELPGFKTLGAFAPGRAMVKSRNVSDEGAWRSAHEIWTVNSNGPPRLEGQLFKIDDRNINNEINLPDRFAKERSGQPGFDPLISKISEDAVPDVFAISRMHGLYLNPYDYRKGTSFEWPPMAECIEHRGSYFLISAYSTMKGFARRHGVFKVDTPESRPQLLVDFGWQRYHGNFAGVLMSTDSSIHSSVVHEDWLHFLRDHEDCPPHWGAVNLATGETRVLVVDLWRDLEYDARQFANSSLFGLLLYGGAHAYKVELPPSESWPEYDEAVAQLRFPEGQLPEDDANLWKPKRRLKWKAPDAPQE